VLLVEEMVGQMAVWLEPYLAVKLVSVWVELSVVSLASSMAEWWVETMEND